MSHRETVDISVIVVTYNREGVLQQTLECVLKQEPAPAEIIVVDQTRQHTAPVQEYLETSARRGQIRYIVQPEPNAQRARNRAIAEAHGDVLLFLDDDVVMESDLVGNHWKNYEADPAIAAVAGLYLVPGEEPEPIEELPAHCLLPVTGWIVTPHCYNRRSEDWHLLPTCNGSIKREVALRLGGFDENYTFTQYDDTDFSCRLKELGVKSVHDPTAKLIHLKEPSGGRRPGGTKRFISPDSAMWYTWCYFYGSNFKYRHVALEIGSRLRTYIFNRPNVLRPWRLATALKPALLGACRAALAMRRGRQLLDIREMSRMACLLCGLE